MKKPVHIDDFCSQCGFFNSNTCVNNGYGCNHPEQSEFDYVSIKNPQKYVLEKKVYLALLRRKYKSYHNVVAERNYNQAMVWLTSIKYDEKLLSEVGVKLQGRCYSFSCPIAQVVEKEDWIELGENPENYEEDSYVIPHTDVETII